MLRKILYADTEALDNYISIIDGYLYDEQEITKSSTTNKGGKVGVGIKTINAEGNLGNQKEEKIALNAKITDASKLDKIIKYLKDQDELRYYENINEKIWNDIYRDNFIEVLVTPRFSKLEEVTKVANNFKQLIDAFEPFLGNTVDKKGKEALNGFEQLSNSRNSNSLSCVFNFEDIKSMASNREQIRKMNKKNMSNPAGIKDKVNGPAFIVIPIAIYQ